MREIERDEEREGGERVGEKEEEGREREGGRERGKRERKREREPPPKRENKKHLYVRACSTCNVSQLLK